MEMQVDCTTKLNCNSPCQGGHDCRDNVMVTMITIEKMMTTILMILTTITIINCQDGDVDAGQG